MCLTSPEPEIQSLEIEAGAGGDGPLYLQLSFAPCDAGSTLHSARCMNCASLDPSSLSAGSTVYSC